MEQTRVDVLREEVAHALDGLEGVIALRATQGCAAPYLFRSKEELGELAVSPKYPLPTVLQVIQRVYPESRLGIVCRGCEERGLVEMAKRNQVNLGNVWAIGLACTAEEATECRCNQPYPDVFVGICVGEKVPGVANDLLPELLALGMSKRREFWQRQFAKCIKCYGCRNSCPQCSCTECALEEELWVKKGRLPPPFPVFHLLRAMHTAGKCVGCRECELCCPADIPLTMLYTLLRRDVRELFGYETGRSVEDKPPLVSALED
jgi:formate dehydrogenase subunit beta